MGGRPLPLGALVGPPVGEPVGALVGPPVGFPVGEPVGALVGPPVGKLVAAQGAVALEVSLPSSCTT